MAKFVAPRESASGTYRTCALTGLTSAFGSKRTFTNCCDLTVIRANFENARKTLWTEHELRAAKPAPERTLY